MSMTYTINPELFCITFVNSEDVEDIYVQYGYPLGIPFESEEAASLWAEDFIESIDNPEGYHPPFGPGLEREKKIIPNIPTA